MIEEMSEISGSFRKGHFTKREGEGFSKGAKNLGREVEGWGEKKRLPKL